MLPAESFVDVVSFLGYYDLGGLKLANKQFPAVANQCADAIRSFDFSDFTFFVHGDRIDVHRFDSAVQKTRVARFQKAREKIFTKFISTAFRNCTVERLVLVGLRKLALDAIKGVANTIVVAHLHVSVAAFENAQASNSSPVFAKWR